LLKQVTLLTKEAVDYILPRESSRDAMIAAVASQERSDLIDTIDTDRFNKTLVLPIRDIIDRGGKSWRGLAFLLCIDVVGGNSNKFRTILGSIEILHVGSMIVDDVQDRSSIRRGGPACHVVVGEPLAINAGTFAYFLGIQSALSNVPWLHPKKQLRYYQEYGLVLRAGHFGQALDLSGLDKEMESAVTSGCNKELIHHVLAIHRLKTAVAAGAVARTGAAFGGGTEIQQEYLCAYYESLGTAFQIVDDVLNLSGFSQGQKECGEDISEGKVTYPVAVALSFLKLDDRKRLWMMIRSHPKDDAIRECIDMIRQTGAFDIAKKHADEMVEKAWKVLAPIIPESKYKTMLFSFGRFVLERWY
jgi:geranylgeranyl pyrophosphate synthase